MIHTAASLLADAETYEGQEVEVAGTLLSGREELSLGDHDDAGQRLWLSLREGNPTVRGPLRSGREVVATGVFHAGPCGHLDRFGGELRPLVEVRRRKKSDSTGG
jgi:hypothetical protein